MHAFLMLAALLPTGCATIKKPAKVTPQNVYMVLYGGTFRRYPVKDSRGKEQEVETSEIVGGMCLTPDDWAEREKYILELEAFSEAK